jgi:hypothetical protein
VGILDQISIFRSPATADLKQDQYSTILVQLVRCELLRFTTLLSGSCGRSQQHFALQLLISGLSQPAQFLKPVLVCRGEVKASLSLHCFLEGRGNSI